MKSAQTSNRRHTGSDLEGFLDLSQDMIDLPGDFMLGGIRPLFVNDQGKDLLLIRDGHVDETEASALSDFVFGERDPDLPHADFSEPGISIPLGGVFDEAFDG